VGDDLSESAGRFFGTLPGIASAAGIVTVPEPNNRVTLHYEDSSRRTEVLSGAVPGWEWPELAPLVNRCDALYINFIAGWELDLDSACALRREFGGPIYCDLHSIFLGIGPDGTRTPRALDSWREWLACFDFVQLNETEFNQLAASWGDPWQLAAEVVGEETLALLVTMGDRGAAWVGAPGFDRLGSDGRDVVPELEPVDHKSTAAARSGMVDQDVRHKGDPTGCGDVWGIACFIQLLRGATLPEAVRSANHVAARNASFRGASDLARLLRATGPVGLQSEGNGS
jgi:sugar/nucleoside kinase (ribokinase family)